MTQMNQPGTITCPHCGQTYSIAAAQWPLYVGRSIACTKCGKPFAVSGGGTPAAAPAPPLMPPAMPQGYPPPGVYPQGGYPQQGYAPPPAKSGLSGGWIALIVIGAICVVAIPCLIAILLPALNTVRQEALKAKCSSNMKNIGTALFAYANSNNGAYPDSMATLVRSGQLMPQNVVCPDDTNATPFTKSAGSITNADLIGHDSYVYVGGGQNSSASSNAVLLYESLSNHHNRGMNVLYGDYHVSWVPANQAQQIISQYPSKQNGL